MNLRIEPLLLKDSAVDCMRGVTALLVVDGREVLITASDVRTLTGVAASLGVPFDPAKADETLTIRNVDGGAAIRKCIARLRREFTSRDLQDRLSTGYGIHLSLNFIQQTLRRMLDDKDLILVKRAGGRNPGIYSLP